MAMGEFDLIGRYFARSAGRDDVVVGVGDDGAVLRPKPGNDLIAVVDTMVEAVHFPPQLPAGDIAWRAVAANMSDIAAMGGRARWVTLALTLLNAEESWLEAFADGLYAAIEAGGASLVGGDTTRGESIVVSVQVIGEVEAGQALRRSGARSGDGLYVSGSVGDAAAGLRQLQADGPRAKALVSRFSRPEPRLELGRSLAGIATAAIDVSDGLHDDAAKMLAASGLGASLELADLPISNALSRAFPDEAEMFALTGGDDYELCFTAPPSENARLEALATELAIPITRIGSVEEDAGIRCLRGGRPVTLNLPGYDHFRDADG